MNIYQVIKWGLITVSVILLTVALNTEGSVGKLIWVPLLVSSFAFTLINWWERTRDVVNHYDPVLRQSREEQEYPNEGLR